MLIVISARAATEDGRVQRTSSEELGARLRALPASIGATTLVGIDGFSGAGKTVLAQLLGEQPGIAVVSIEEFFLGWTGLAAGIERARHGLVEPLRRGETPCWRPWDWVRGEEGEPQPRPITMPVVLLEGCGAGARSLREVQAATWWVDATAEERERRLRAREDWPEYAAHRESWRRQEQELADAEDTPDSADLVLRWRVDGSLSVATSPHR